MKEPAYSKNPSVKKMRRVYVQNRDGKPLMPTRRNGAVRRWLRDGKAKVVDMYPFTIRLTGDHQNFISEIKFYDTKFLFQKQNFSCCENKTQEVVVGLDTGAVTIGCSTVSGCQVLFASEMRLRTDIHKKMVRRAMYRRTRRNRKTRYRQARFDNRTRPKGWLPPSLRSKADATTKAVLNLSKILPVSKVRIEIAKFDIQKLQNPDISGKEYQEGQMAGYDNVRAYVFERDKYTCQICKKKLGILETHHIIQRKDGGSDRQDNLAAVHEECHKKFHAGEIKHTFRKPRQYRAETQVTILKNVIVAELEKHFEVETTYGYITKRNRLRLGLEKTHYNDAIAICNPREIEPTDGYHQFVCRSHGRYQLTKGVRSEKYLPTKPIFGFDVGDRVLCTKNKGKQIGFIKGRMSTGYFVISDIVNKTIVPCTSHKFLRLIEFKDTIQSQFIPHQSEIEGGLLG